MMTESASSSADATPSASMATCSPSRTRPAIALDINIRAGLPLAGNSEDWLAGAKLPKGASLRMWTFQMLYEALLEMTMETEVSWGGSFAYRDAPGSNAGPVCREVAKDEISKKRTNYLSFSTVFTKARCRATLLGP